MEMQSSHLSGANAFAGYSSKPGSDFQQRNMAVFGRPPLPASRQPQAQLSGGASQQFASQYQYQSQPPSQYSSQPQTTQHQSIQMGDRDILQREMQRFDQGDFRANAAALSPHNPHAAYSSEMLSPGYPPSGGQPQLQDARQMLQAQSDRFSSHSVGNQDPRALLQQQQMQMLQPPQQAYPPPQRHLSQNPRQRHPNQMSNENPLLAQNDLRLSQQRARLGSGVMRANSDSRTSLGTAAMNSVFNQTPPPQQTQQVPAAAPRQAYQSSQFAAAFQQPSQQQEPPYPQRSVPQQIQHQQIQAPQQQLQPPQSPAYQHPSASSIQLTQDQHYALNQVPGVRHASYQAASMGQAHHQNSQAIGSLIKRDEMAALGGQDTNFQGLAGHRNRINRALDNRRLQKANRGNRQRVLQMVLAAEM